MVASHGSQFQGGTSGDGADAAAYETGGGGGGGYFGGGGGGLNSSPYDAPGGGGSGHVDPVVTGGSTAASSSYTPLGVTDAQYVSGVGVGGGTSTSHTAGGNGLAVFEFNLEPVALVAPQLPVTGVDDIFALQLAAALFAFGGALLILARASRRGQVRS